MASPRLGDAASRPRERRGRVSASAIALAFLLAGAVSVRVWLMLAYGPAFLGFGDSHEYVTAAAVGVFHDVQKPAGYPIFLQIAHLLSDRLAFTIFVQHALGIATGVLLYGAVRRSGAPAWLGLFPAAVVFFGGTGLLLEHALLGDSLFAFLQAVGLYATVRALARPSVRWALLAGAAVGACFWVKTVGLANVALVPCVLLAGARGTVRARLPSAAAAAAVGVAMVLGYSPVQALVAGRGGYERQGAWNLYGRVATFVDCSRFSAAGGHALPVPHTATLAARIRELLPVRSRRARRRALRRPRTCARVRKRGAGTLQRGRHHARAAGLRRGDRAQPRLLLLPAAWRRVYACEHPRSRARSRRHALRTAGDRRLLPR